MKVNAEKEPRPDAKAEQETPENYIGQLRTAIGMDPPPMDGDASIQRKEIESAANDSPQVKQLKALQSGINQSEQVTQYRAQQEAATQSPQVQQFRQVQEAANQSTQVHNTGMPHQLKDGIESLSGMAMDHVKVNYNSSKPAEMNALAYAQGSDIHLGPGQEEHLPHEAWHVVQQAQGRVQPTVQMKGMSVNDDDTLEREADIMGQRALQTKKGPQSLRPATPTSGSLQRKVIQMIATQITMKDGLIDKLMIRGRPKNTFGSSMGDHTTAFIVHQEGLAVAFKDSTIIGAFETLEKLVNGLEYLPGYEEMEIHGQNANTGIGIRFLEELARAKEALKLEKGTKDDILISQLQIAVDAYLGARELIPFSTINTKAKDANSAGKGKGESGHAAIMSEYERGRGDISDEELIDAVYGLFDPQSAGMLATERNDGMLGKMTGQIIQQRNLETTDAFERIWRQHLQSIETMFPCVYDKIGKQLEEHPFVDHLEAMEGTEIKKWQHKINSHLITAKGYYEKFGPVGGQKLLKKETFYYNNTLDIATAYRIENQALTYLKEIQEVNNAYENKFSEELMAAKSSFYIHYANTKDRRPADVAENIVNNSMTNRQMGLMKGNFETDPQILSEDVKFTQDKMKHIVSIKGIAEGDPLVREGFAKENPFAKISKEESDGKTSEDSDFDKEENQDSNSVENEAEKLEVPMNGESYEEEFEEEEEFDEGAKLKTLSSENLLMTVQIILDKEGKVIRMITGNRPISPFSGTMGAHSTAWKLHLDRVESRIVGESIANSIPAILQLGKEVNAFYELQKEEPMNEKAQDRLPKAQDLMTNLMAAKNEGIVDLQNLINAILSFYNLIPGVSREKANTLNHGEQSHRGTLINYEKQSQFPKTALTEKQKEKSIQNAIAGLFDGNKQEGSLWDNHLKIIFEVYPKCLKLGFPVEYKNRATGLEEEDWQGNAQWNPRELDKKDAKIKVPYPIDELEFFEQGVKLMKQNNRLVYAICKAAGLGLPTEHNIFKIREPLGLRANKILPCSPTVLDNIMKEFGLEQGVVIFHRKPIRSDQSTKITKCPLLLCADGEGGYQATNDYEKPPRKLVQDGDDSKREPSKWKQKQAEKDKEQKGKVREGEGYSSDEREFYEEFKPKKTNDRNSQQDIQSEEDRSTQVKKHQSTQ